jgi:hypothetical protein
MDHVEGLLRILLVGKRGSPSYLTNHISLFSFFTFFLSFTSMRKEESMMNHIDKRGRSIVALALYWCLHMIMQHVLDMQA